MHLRILREANEAGFTDLVPAHLAVLRYPGPDGRRPSDLAAEVGTTKQAMNYLLGQLEQLGYVERRDDPGDQRSKRVHLTKRGQVLRSVIRRTVTKIERELEDELGTTVLRPAPRAPRSAERHQDDQSRTRRPLSARARSPCLRISAEG